MKATDIYGKEHDVSPDTITWRPSVYAIIIQDDKILLSPQFGGYVLPGGGVELEETLENALVRELREETGLDCKPLRQIDFCEIFFILPDIKKEVVHSLCYFYEAQVVGGAITTEFLEADEMLSTKRAEWISIGSLDKLLWVGSIDFLAIIRNYLSNIAT
jgi:ADP-ribose pyrophosphatase YjhB (NUDIX family)